jgi:hypothetical protein
MDYEPLVTERIEAGARFLREFEKYAPVSAAFWLRQSERRFWHLYVASDKITDDNFDLSYGEVVRITRQLRDPWLESSRVKVINTDDPAAQEALARQRLYPGRALPRVYDTFFGNVMADEVYIYPLPLPTVDTKAQSS